MLITEIKHNNLHRLNVNKTKCVTCGKLVDDMEEGEPCPKRSAKNELSES